ncbi:uncharacterized protein DUF4369 [Lutibacter sp. Hel_I_33_5]|uniref:DUF4369 domain-containing protein n=1 Tax=Lutibacter sp. Hel_I_33_5 TaxID=1566289 RepID=UPI00119DFA9A|nr:DUF4369 domain-containing protein [Lutibacter sp. Hel_I_33_5]TVZ55281.1 uncharacterized protein DUF4369 [Lutibacter sp. Hel_I_33_5]
MRNNIFILVASIFILSCTSKKEGNMIVSGQIKGLKKGTLYLQKMKDTSLFSVDSLKLIGTNIFTLSDNVESPELYYLTFNTNNKEQRILFFGEQGTITINDNLEKFGVKTEITGSKNQEILERYFKINKQFKNKQLDLLKENFDAKISKDETKIAEVAKKSKNLLKRSYLFTVNFAMNNNEYEAAPYIALTELANANIKFLDTINRGLTEKVKNSLYGKQFQNFIDNIKKSEK